MNLAAWLITLVGPLVLKAFFAIGLGTITFTGVTIALDQLIQAAMSNWSSVGADVLGLASVAGIPQCLGLICGAMTARVGMWAAASATKFLLSST